MAEFLSDAWLEDLARAAATAALPPDLHLVIQQVVEQDSGTACAYAIRIAAGVLTVEPGRADDADVSFTQDRSTAAAIARGELSAQAAFMAGRLRVGGDLRLVLDRARELGSIDDLFAQARESTSW
ncbi:MAG: SCP2 sterol-binding domain-containing protein [Microthrixaceae bacterium]